MNKKVSITLDGSHQLTNRDLRRYLDAKGYKLIPLKGKVPIHKDWTKRWYNPAQVIKFCREKGLNVGVCLTEEQLVVDVDPRNGGELGWLNLCLEFGIDELIFPAVSTGGGGAHYYMSLPAGIKVMNTLKDYPGVEFKSKGRQVVAAGSIHPETLKHYVWKDGASLADAPPCPATLLAAITRPERAVTSGGGELTPEQVEAVLARLDPLKFNTNDTWVRLMMAIHHATLGDARQEWIDWSTSDPEFAHDAEHIGRRWDSLHTAKAGETMVTIGTLRHILAEANALDVLPPDQDAAQKDFEGEDAPDFDALEDNGEDDEPIKLSHINADNIDKVFKLASIGGRVRIVFLGGKSTLDKSVRVPEIWLEEDFKRALRNKYVNVLSKTEGDEVVSKRMPLANWWLTKKDRYTYNGLIFDSTHCDSEEDEINLWRGFSVEPKSGDWSSMRNHIRNVIADGNDASDSYIMKWLAWAVQNPTKHCEVAMVLLSEEKGTGKGFLGRAMCRLFGVHGHHISQRSHLVGKFNAHFIQCGLLFCDEVIWPGHKEDEGVVKALITEETLTVEPKGINAYSVLNALKLILASNEPWVVSASGNERRYAVFEVSDKHKQDHGYFKRINDQLDNGGLGAMLHDLLVMDLEGWHPRQDIPQTEALARQKTLTAEPAVTIMADILESGNLPGRHGKPNRARASELYEYMRKRSKILGYWSDNKFAEFMKKMGAKRGRSNGTVWDFPPLGQARTRFHEARPWWPAFEASVTDWESEFTEGDDE